MKTVSVVVLKPHPYDGIPRKVGETYEADEKFLNTLTVIGLVKVAEPTSNPKKGRHNTRDMRAER